MTAILPNPFIEQRADTLAGLRSAELVVVWRKPDSSPCSELIWAPELHHIDGQWVIYFAATPILTRCHPLRASG